MPKKFFRAPIAEFGIEDCLNPKFLNPISVRIDSQSVFALPAALKRDL